MKKSKILGIAIVAAMITSISAINVSAIESAELKDHSVGICGSFTNWGNPLEDQSKIEDIPMSDDDGDGIYEGVIDIPEVTAAMISEAMTDDGNGNQISRGFSGVQFKVRLDNAWKTGWGEYEEDYGRTENSQTNCCVQAEAGKPLKVIVKLDSTKSIDPDVIPNGDSDEYKLWGVSYEVVDAGTTEQSSAAPVEESSAAPVEESSAAPVEESSEAAPVEESSEAAPVEESTEDSSTPSTGDTTSAVALVAVVMASLGAAVVMTKKAASKE